MFRGDSERRLDGLGIRGEYLTWRDVFLPASLAQFAGLGRFGDLVEPPKHF